MDDDLTFEPTLDLIRGRIVSHGLRGTPIAIACDGVAWATVAAYARANEPEISDFSCALPPISAPTTSRVVATDTRGELVASGEFRREPRRNAHGLLGIDVYETDHHPFFTLPFLSFDGALLTLSGMHLPPAGDPSKLTIAFEPGVAYDVRYGMPSPEFGNHYWYWPNAHQSGLSVEIDLTASSRRPNPFHFRCTYRSGAGMGSGKRPVDVWIPNRLDSFLDFPADSTQMTRVQTYSTPATVAVTGYNAFKTMEALFEACGIDRTTGPSLLDWGCGHGRVTTHFIDAWPSARIVGLDVDAENIAWCREHLTPGTFAVAALWPPCPLDDASFDGLFGISVMTHLRAEAQRAWFAELARLLRPGGIALLTFQAEAGAAYASSYRDQAWWTNWLANPFDEEQRAHVIREKISDPDYYRSTTQSTDDFVRASEPFFKLVRIEPAIFGGYQDCAILRKR